MRKPPNYEFNKLVKENALAHTIMETPGGTAEDCAVGLAKENEWLRNRVAALISIAPKRLRVTGGEDLIWRCPEKAVPFNLEFREDKI